MMPTSAIGERESGFTLTELLVVIAIMAVLASAVLLSAPDAHSSLLTEVERFGARLLRAKEEAILSGRTIEVHVSTDGYGFDVVRPGARVPLIKAPFGNVAWNDVTNLAIPNANAQARVAFDPTGLATPIAVDFLRGVSRVRVSVEANGRVSVDAPLQ